MRLILPAGALLALLLPAAASATVFKADLREAPAQLIRIGDDDDDDRRRGRRHRDDRREYREDRREYRQNRRDERRAYRQGYREGRREAAHNSYYRPGGDYGRRRYSRGQYLPREHLTYVVSNYRDYGYPPPPRGCRYVQVGQDTYLTQIATGLILNAFSGGRY